MEDTKHIKVKNWIPIDVGKCSECNHEMEITGAGGIGLNLTCRNYDCDCYPACTYCSVFGFGKGREEYSYIELHNGRKCWFECTKCGSNEVHRNVYDDGCGYFDINIVCQECGHDCWY
jgi:hypothetical protein